MALPDKHVSLVADAVRRAKKGESRVKIAEFPGLGMLELYTLTIEHKGWISLRGEGPMTNAGKRLRDLIVQELTKQTKVEPDTMSGDGGHTTYDFIVD